jgi:hypothetical protein
MNSLDRYFEKLARQHFTNLGITSSEIDYKIAQLMDSIQKGYINRSTMIKLAKMGLAGSSK